MTKDRTALKVAVFTAVMLVVGAGLVVTFGKFRLSSSTDYHALFENASRLKAGQDVRIAGIPVGEVKAVDLSSSGDVDVTFTLNAQYRIYSSSRAVIRYENLIGDRYLEITSGPGDLRLIHPGDYIDESHTQPALDLDALLGGLRPVLKGLDGGKVNEISNAIIQLLQGQGGTLSDALASTGQFTTTLAGQDQLIGDVVANLGAVLKTVSQGGARFDESVDRLQQLISGLSGGRDVIANALPPLASTTTDLTELLENGRRPLQGVVENLRPLATTLDARKDEINAEIDPLAENYARLNQLGTYGSFFNIFFCSVRLKINGPAGSDLLVPLQGPADLTKGRCAEDG